MYTRLAGQRLTLREMAQMHGQSVGFPQIVGTPEQVADQLEAYYRQAGGDGFMLTMPYTPGAIEECRGAGHPRAAAARALSCGVQGRDITRDFTSC